MHDVHCIFQSGDTVIIAGRSWAIMREMPTGNETLAQFFMREDRWDCVISTGAHDNIIFDPHTIAIIAYTLAAEQIGQVSDLPDLATVGPTVAKYLATAPPDAPVERVGWDGKTVLRCWWITPGSAVTTVIIDELEVRQ